MGQQQILLIVLSVILVGIAIAVGITMFRAQARNSNLDGIISDLNNLGSIAYQYKIRPVSMGGGGGEYGENDTTSAIGFGAYFAQLDLSMRKTDNGWYFFDSIGSAIPPGGTTEDETVVLHGWNDTYKHGRELTIYANGQMRVTDSFDETDDGSFTEPTE